LIFQYNNGARAETGLFRRTNPIVEFAEYFQLNTLWKRGSFFGTGIDFGFRCLAWDTHPERLYHGRLLPEPQVVESALRKRVYRQPPRSEGRAN
jgi:hypothetical protein